MVNLLGADDDNKIRMVLIDLTEFPRSGPAQVLIRVQNGDKQYIDMAAQILGVNQSDFLRIAIINTAKKVIAENIRNGKAK